MLNWTPLFSVDPRNYSALQNNKTKWPTAGFSHQANLASERYSAIIFQLIFTGMVADFDCTFEEQHHAKVSRGSSPLCRNLFPQKGASLHMIRYDYEL